MLQQKIVCIPPVDFGYSEVLAAVFRSLGLHAEALPVSDQATREIFERHTSGDECFPFQVLAGDVIKRLQKGDVEPSQLAFFLPIVDGACRYGRFAANLEDVLKLAGYGDAMVFAPNRYAAFAGLTPGLDMALKNGWRALVAADILQRLLLRYRPYELVKGAADELYDDVLTDLCNSIEEAPEGLQQEAVLASLERACARFHVLEHDDEQRLPVIGVVGEFYGRFSPLLNNDLIRAIERCGGQVRLMGVAAETLLYFAALGIRINEGEEDFLSAISSLCEREGLHDESDAEAIVQRANPYMPFKDTIPAFRLGQMVTMAQEGVDGIIDANFFPCMVASACAAFYSQLMDDLDDIPMDPYFFKGGNKNIIRRVEKFFKTIGKQKGGRARAEHVAA